MLEPAPFKCYVCDKSKPILKLKNFVVLWYSIQALICFDCWSLETDEPKEGDWNDAGCSPKWWIKAEPARK